MIVFILGGGFSNDDRNEKQMRNNFPQNNDGPNESGFRRGGFSNRGGGGGFGDRGGNLLGKQNFPN
jgi:hypothetical protein